MKTKNKIKISLVFFLLFVFIPGSLTDAANNQSEKPTVKKGAKVITIKGVTRSWQDTNKTPLDRRPGPRKYKVVLNFKPVRKIVRPGTTADPVVQRSYTSPEAPSLPYMPEPTMNFAGMNFVSNGSGWPPDPNGDVGPTYYVQTVNTSIGIFRKSNGSLVSATTFDDFFEGGALTGTPCDENNNGDPIVLYDQYSQRWFLLDFAWDPSEKDGSYFSIAVSKTGDPTGDWWLYAFRADNTMLNDYPKAGIWHDGIYITANMFQFTGFFQGVKVWAIKKPDIYNGTLIAQVVSDNSWSAWSILPGNSRGTTPPPSTAPNYMYSFDADEWGGSETDVLTTWKYDVDWTNPANTTWTGPYLLPTAAFSLKNGNIPQKDTLNKLDAIGDRLMFSAVYRKFSTHESVYLCHLVSVAGTGAMRWYEVRIDNGSSSIYQQGTYAPDTDHRWMGSIAADHQGNMAVGYSVSSNSMYPAIRWAGRLVNDPLNELSQGEASLIEGTGSQTLYDRWGDYSAMTIDPVDDETFWYTHEYYNTTGTNWQTRIGSFKLAAEPPGITVTSPNGGEGWLVNSTHSITWTTTGTVGNVKIKYSPNNGQDWTSIIASTPNDGAHPWTVPDTPSPQCLVRISETDNDPVDTSDAVFSIVDPNTITITSPNGGETFEVNSSHTITWITDGTVGDVKIEYSANNGVSWTEIIASTANDGTHPWDIPGLASSYYLVRIYETDGSPVDTSDSVFAVTALPSITITSPQGGMSWEANSSQTITWKTTGNVEPVQIEYSIDNGETWTVIIASTPNDGSQPWTVPGTPSSRCLVRIAETDGEPSDTSDGWFAITAPISITVTSPNGQEYWPVDAARVIQWKNTGAVGNVKIEYSTDNGENWTGIIGSTANNGTYPWTVPDSVSSQCLVRISETDGDPVDTSDALFTIEEPTSITVTSPNGGEQWMVNSSPEITWTSSGNIGTVIIDYSVDNGETWTNAATAVENDGSYTWLVPGRPSDNCLIRIIGRTTDGNWEDVSDAVFSIVPPGAGITVISPNGGENLVSGSTYEITWTSTGSIPRVFIELTTDNRNTWFTVVPSTENDGSYEWIVPNTPSTGCQVRISQAEVDNKSITDASDAVFSIIFSPSPFITVTSPNGGESLGVGEPHLITWTNTGAINNVKIEYSNDSGSTWAEIIQSTPNTGSYEWTVPDDPSNLCLVKVSDTESSAADASNAVFSIISPPTLSVVFPNGGENLEGGTTQAITWTSTGMIDSVKIEYSTDNGDSWTVLDPSVINDGSYNWTIPDITADNCLVRVSNTDNDEVKRDTSDAVFSIFPSQTPGIMVTSPNGGENWEVNSSRAITWTTIGTVGNVKIEYSIDNGQNWVEIIGDTANNGSYPWTIPDTVSNQCLVRISESDGDPADTGDAMFSIVTPSLSSITVISPNGGETWETGSFEDITWTSTGALEEVKIEYSFDNGDSWNTIVTAADNTGTYNWNVPGTPSPGCRVRVVGVDNDEKPSDVSDGVFTISPAFTVTFPNGGENLSGSFIYEITWTGSETWSHVSLEYSTDAGADWKVIEEYTENTGSYDWRVPYDPSARCLIRIRGGHGDTGAMDISDAVFTIGLPSSAPITVITPNGGEILTGGDIYSITWSSGSDTEEVKIEYSTNVGNSWTVITDSLSNMGIYEWQVPGISSASCLVRVSQVNGTKFDVSDAPFIITGNPLGEPVTVATPNGGETLTAGSFYEITWTGAGNIDNVMIEYSMNNGDSWVIVTESTPNDGSYLWTVPYTNSGSCLVRISGGVGDNSAVDTSDAVFSIISP
jgi:hypothetical protein